MKKIIFIVFCFLSFGAVAQTKIGATLVRNSPTDTYAITFDSLQRGGMHVYSTITERNAIPNGLRKKGMLAAVDTLIYQLKTGVTNTDWQIFAIAGQTGSQGIQGVQGVSGTSGSQGITGSTGLSGAVGATGATGPQGIQGVQGTSTVGPSGLNWRGTWVSGTSYIQNDAVAYGGASWFCFLATSGTTTPNVDNTHWALLASQGAAGANGATGAQGSTGLTGLTGATGIQGTTGTNGSQGITGATGAQGIQGLNGTTGTAGTNGATGSQGIQGIQGIQGATGSAASQNLQQVTNIDSTTTTKIIARTYKATGIPIFENNTAAIAGGLLVGDMYRLPYNNGNYLVAIVSSINNPFDRTFDRTFTF